ncbi:MAG TPA: SseB family protein [Dermatophilaceae bacterium]
MSPQRPFVNDAPRPREDALDRGLADESAVAVPIRHTRVLTGTGFDNDTGEADPDLSAALTDGRDQVGLLAAVASARLIVPVVAAPSAGDPDELKEPRSADMAMATLTSQDGQRALPVFSSVTALRAWDPDARPSPVTSARAAQAAVTERCDVLLLDVGSEHPQVLRPSMVWALAQQREWLPAHTDPFVAQTLSRATANEADVIECFGEEGDPAGAGILRVVLRLRPGLDQAQVQALATRVGEQIATDGEARARIDGLAFVIRPA